MLSNIKDTIFGFIVICFIAVLCWLVWQSKAPVETAVVKSSITADSLEALKPSIRYAKPIGTIGDPCKLYELATKDGYKIYITVCNAEGVTASTVITPEKVIPVYER